MTVFKSFGDSREFFACAAAVSQSGRREIKSFISVCKQRRPERLVWNLHLNK